MSLRTTIVVAALLIMPTVIVAGDNPPSDSCSSALVKNLTGRWQLNNAKGKQITGRPSESFTQQFEPNETGGIKSTGNLVRDDGIAQHVEYSANFDGKEYPSYRYGPESGNIVLKCIDEHTLETLVYRPGSTKVAVTKRWELSKDGKTLTCIEKGANTRGQAIEAVSVWDKL